MLVLPLHTYIVRSRARSRMVSYMKIEIESRDAASRKPRKPLVVRNTRWQCFPVHFALIGVVSNMASFAPIASGVSQQRSIGVELGPNDSADITVSDFLSFTDIIPDLLDQTHANEWSTNVPGYLFGLALGSGEGTSAVGVGLGEILGRGFAATVGDCSAIQWTDHDGTSFGSEQLTARGLPAVIDWVRHHGVVHVRVNPTPSALAMIFLEGLDILPPDSVDGAGNGGGVRFRSPGDLTVYTLTTSVTSYTGVVTVTPSTRPGWISPGQIALQMINSTATRNSGYYVPVSNFRSFTTQKMSFLFFKSVSEFSFAISKDDRSSLESTFPAGVFTDRQTEYMNQFSSESARLGMANLLGNLGRFTGELVVSDPDHIVTVATTAVSLTAIGPSRSRFPRGFLWDEGFHLLAVEKINPALAVEIVTSWLRTQAVTTGRGWIPRELALSARDKASIPSEFLPQNPLIANPPTLLFVIRKWIKSGFLHGAALATLGHHLVRWFDHLKKTQKSDYPSATCYRWKPRTSAHCLSSGLDDYPRGPTVNPDECHLDLHVWMMLFVDTIRDVCSHVNPDYCETGWDDVLTDMKGSLRSVFQVPNTPLLADWIGHQPFIRPPPVVGRADGTCVAGLVPCPSDRPCCSPSGTCGTEPEFCHCDGCVPNIAPPATPIHSPHIGYVTLFPLMLGQLSPRTDVDLIEYIVHNVLTPAVLSSEFGVLSLSRADPLFGSAEDYWRGNIWANLNLLTAASLVVYGSRMEKFNRALSEEMKTLGERIKAGWTAGMKNAWTKSNGPREYLRPLTGAGGGVYPFAGWTASTMFLYEQDDWWQFWIDSVGISDNDV